MDLEVPINCSRMGSFGIGSECGTTATDANSRPENALDALLDELQTFSKPHSSHVSTQLPQDHQPPALPQKGSSLSLNHPHLSELGRKGSMDSANILPVTNLTVSTGSLRRLHSYPSGSDTDSSPPIQPLQREANKPINKPPLPERNQDLLMYITSNKRTPPPPPPRTSSKSPLASPTSPVLPPRPQLNHQQRVNIDSDDTSSQSEPTKDTHYNSTAHKTGDQATKDCKSQTLPRNIGSNLQPVTDNEVISASNSSSCESINSQDSSKKNRKEELENRHRELLKKQKALQEQYARLQQLQRGNNNFAVAPPTADQLLKKTGSESNLLQKMGLQMTTSQMTGSLTNLPGTANPNVSKNTSKNVDGSIVNTTKHEQSESDTYKKQVYETDIL